MSDSFQYGRGGSRWTIVAVASIGIVAVLFVVLRQFSKPPAIETGEELIIYCASGIRKPVEELAKTYTKKFGTPIRIEHDSSGGLEGKLMLDEKHAKARADLYIPADAFFANRAAEKGLVRESIPLALQRLVLAKKPGSSLVASNVDELLASGKKYVLCNKEAGVGKKTSDALGDRYADVAEAAKTKFPRVTEAASSIKASSGIDAGFIWDATAAHYGLDIVELEELTDATSNISVNVVVSSENPAAALRFARFLSAPQAGGPVFTKHGYTPIAGDAWAERPEIKVYCGGVNRGAVEETINEFQRREGVDVLTEYAGCGTLVTSIDSIKSGRAGHFPDAFITCDASYLDKVAGDFGTPQDVSSTRIVMLIRKENEKTKDLEKVEDLAKADLAIGTTDRTKSTLGDLTWQIFEDVGIKDQLESQRNVVVTTGTAHELIMQMLAHSKLDVALVYEANCVNLGDGYKEIPVDHPLARAVQNVAVAKQSPYPLLTERLMESIRSAESKHRFTANRFTWLGEPPD
ncbi:MAG: substrate-binding domain-containing protein [Pirellulales bacterium]|nr:substrate-binding domain-containing protein [Pirellulales bacterium]